MRTFCSGIGRFSAERRTSIAGRARAGRDGLALGVLRSRSRPADALSARLPRRSTQESAAGRDANVGSDTPIRRRTPRGQPWHFRADELDPAGHINNSHYWVPLEEELAAGPEPESIDAEIEYRDPAEAGRGGPAQATGSSLWITGHRRRRSTPRYRRLLSQLQGQAAARAIARPIRGAGVLGDRVDDPRPDAAGQVVAHALDLISRAPGIAFAVARPPDGLIILSTVPWMTSVGAGSSASCVGAVARGDDRAELAPAGAHVEAAVVAAGGALANVLLVAREARRSDQAEDLGGRARRSPRGRGEGAGADSW